MVRFIVSAYDFSLFGCDCFGVLIVFVCLIVSDVYFGLTLF